MSAESIRIANTIAYMDDTLAGTSTLLLLLNSPNFLSTLNSLGVDPGSTIGFGRKDGSRHPPLSIDRSIQRIRFNPQYNLDFVGAFLMSNLSIIADALAHNSYFTKSPELEFVRHLRNAINHGNRFFFTPREPCRPAHFSTFTISKSLQGQNAFWSFLMPGDVLDLLEEVESQMRAIP